MAEERVPVKVMGVYAHQDEGVVANHFVLFRDEAKRRIPMFIGQFEAWAISLGLEDKAPDRPFTFDAMLTCLTVAGATVEEAYINDIRDETFYALVTLRVGDQVHQVDMRPSDAVNLAIRVKCPLLINDQVIKTVLENRA
jgi:bifunctional DNase/RNase